MPTDSSDFGGGEFGFTEFGGPGDQSNSANSSEPGGIVDVPPVVVRYPYNVLVV